ncbi:MAG: thioredoxin domain-containing protein [Parvularculaceae bacterium]
MKRNDMVLLGVLLAGAAGFALFARQPAASAAASFNGKPELIAATFNSQWCSSCKILKPRLHKVIADFDGRPVKFVEYDLSFGRDHARANAVADGLGDVYERFSTATGYTLLIDAETGEIIDMLTINHSVTVMQEAVSAALARASGP